MTMRCYPQETANHNVPRSAFLIAEVSQCSGEIVTTYYMTSDKRMFKVCDWAGSVPQPATMSEVCRLTLDTEKILLARAESFFNHTEVEYGR